MSEFLTRKEFETWARNFEQRKSTGAILSTLLLAQGGAFKKPLIIFGSFTANSSAITFTKAFQAAPAIVAITNDVLCHVTYSSLSATGVTLRSIDSATQTLNSSTVSWIAIGESS